MWWDMELESKPDFTDAMKRIYAWYEQAIIDRAPVRFTRHNAEFETSEDIWKPQWRDLKDKWFDEEYQVDKYLRELKGKRVYGETFPVFFPNLGPLLRTARIPTDAPVPSVMALFGTASTGGASFATSSTALMIKLASRWDGQTGQPV